MYTDECEAKGLKAPENITSIPVARELMNPAYFAAYSFAVNTVAWNMLK